MLGKLLKYELKANILFYIIMTVVMAGITLACCGSIQLMVMTDADNPYIDLSCMSVFMLYVVVLVAATIFTTVIIFKRFYSNNFSQEGYLTFTLPVTAKQIYWSKFISALVWEGWTYVLIALSIVGIVLCLAFNYDISFVKDVMSFFGDIYDSSALIIVLYVLEFLVSLIYGIFVMYLSICIGQNFNVHRVVGAIGAYFVVSWIVNTISSVLSTTILVIWGMFEEMQYEYSYDYSNSYSSGEGYIITTMVIQILVYIAVMIGAYIYSIRKMSKGLNLK